MNCQEALALLYDIIDKEASEIDSQQVHEHLQKCSHCLKRYELEGDVNAFVKEKLSHSQPTQQLTSLRSRILCKLDHIDREEGGLKGDTPPFWRASYVVAAAAVLVLALGAVYLATGFSRHQEAYIPLEQAHWQAADHLQSFDNPALTAAAVAFVADTIGYQPSPEVAGVRLVGGQMEEIDGARMAHFIYTNPGTRVVSVFVVPADRFQIPDDLRSSLVNRHGFDLFDHNCRGCRLVYHRVGNALVITATTDRDTELLDFIPGQSTI
jgi:anti-sigma factor (TIGR02949 family)